MSEAEEGRTLIVTGAGGGIGSETARMFHAEGAHVVLVDLHHGPLEDLAAELGTRVDCVTGDAADEQTAVAAMDAAMRSTGRVDDLVLGAGIYPEAAVAEMSMEEWHRCLRINLDSAFVFTRTALAHVGEGGSIVGLTSIAGQRGSKFHAHYAASKGALLSFLRAVALEVAPAVRVNAVAPGTIATEMTRTNRDRYEDRLLADTPLQRFGTPAEVASVIKFLCSPGAGFITGEEISVNGGMYMR